MKARWESKSKSCTKESCGVLHIFSTEYNAHQPATARTQTDQVIKCHNKLFLPSKTQISDGLCKAFFPFLFLFKDTSLLDTEMS